MNISINSLKIGTEWLLITHYMFFPRPPYVINIYVLTVSNMVIYTEYELNYIDDVWKNWVETWS